MNEKLNILKNHGKRTFPKIIKEVYSENFIQEMTKLSRSIEKYKYIAMVNINY